jgi:hypothetical protein
MTGPVRPWREEGGAAIDGERRAAELVKQVAEVPARAMDVARGWDSVLERATQPRPGPWLLAALAVLVAVVGSVALHRRSEPSVVASSGAKWETRIDGSVQLQVGRVQTSRPVDLRLETPHVSILARSCVFAAEVAADGTRVTVSEGEAWVKAGSDAEQVLRAGESRLWPATPPIPALLDQPPPAPSPWCADLEPGRRSECLSGVAQGNGLEAQVALFELARLQVGAGEGGAAVETWRTSLARFPQGVLAPEARLAVLVALTQQRRFDEAVQAAREFEQTSADDPRRPDVTALRRQLEWLARER